MKILVTGSRGQLGTELMKILTTGASELGFLPDKLRGCEVVGVDVGELDITDGVAVDQFFSEVRPALVFNCAAMTNVDGCEAQQALAYRVNADGPGNLAVASARNGVRLLHVSTDYVFSGTAARPWTESDPCEPATAYGRTKLAGERLVLEHCPDACICRTAWLYGYTGNNFVKTMMRLGREKGSVTVVDDQVGNPTCAVDLAYQMAVLAASGETGVFHCTCNSDAVSWYVFTKAIMEAAGIDAEVRPCTTEEYARMSSRPAKRPAYSALDNMRLRETVGDVMRPWRDALDAWMRNYLDMEKNG
jgi:dTDP-4-dehydrorhamnose reductase